MNLVSIIMPYYKKRAFFLISLESILKQTFQNYEIIIIYDDTDNVDLDYILEKKKLDKRIKLIKNDINIGAGFSRNKGISISNGNYIAFLDCDDIWHPEKLERQLNFMKDEKILFSFTSYEVINFEGEIIKYKKAQKKITFTELLSDCNIGLSTVMLEKKLIDNNCQFPILKTKEDFVLWLKISKKTDLYGMDIPLVKWRKLSNSLSSNSFQKLIDGFKVYNRYMKFSLIKSCYLLIILSINFIKKT
ncbi:glycosyltransferase family 2 protein [Candidatus Pelagibacter sp.]|nr:glycosyltransferase family 2 protein [Candidatus Pelagibacter sp.]